MNETIYSSDGLVSGLNADFATARSTGTAVNSSAETSSVGTWWFGSPLNYYNVVRQFQYYDLSAIMGFVLSAKLMIKGDSKYEDEDDSGDSDVYVYEGTQAETLTTEDFNAFGSTLFGSIAYASFNASQYNEIELNAAGIAYIQGKMGSEAKFCFRSGGDVNNNMPTDVNFVTWVSANYSGTGSDPYLYIEYVSVMGERMHKYIPPLRGF